MKEYYISSTKCSIQERQTKNYGRVFDVVFRIVTLDGTEKQKKLSGFKTKTLAKQAHADFITQHCELVKNNPLKKKNAPEKQEPTVGELIPLYIASLHNQNKESSIYEKINIYNTFVLPKYRDTKISDLTKEELYLWQDDIWSRKNERTGEFFSYSYLCKIRTFFSSFLEWVEDRYSYPNNLLKTKRPKRRAPKSKMSFWTVDEFQKFIDVVDDPTYRCFFILLFYTGRRKGEILALSPEDLHGSYISFDKSLTRKTLDDQPYKVTSTKADKTQDIPICKKVQQALEQYEPRQAPFLFGGDTPLSENTVTRTFNRYCEIAGVKEIRIHDLRHSFVSMLIHKGANLMVVADLIGDTVEQVIKTYGHMYDDDKINIINNL